MSHVYYDEEWRKTQDLLSSTLQGEIAQADRRENRKSLATLYVQYILVANRLSECADQIIQPQKRSLVCKLLEATLGRILELKCDLVEADLNEFTYCGDVLESLNCTPLETELIVPACFRNNRKEEIKQRKEAIEDVLRKLGFLEKKTEKVRLTEQQSIMLIQQHERARQGRLRAQFMKEIRQVKEKAKPTLAEGEEGGEGFGKIGFVAALRIQRIWRGYVARKQTRRRKLQEMLLIGMIPPPKTTESEDITRDREVKEMRRELQIQRETEYQETVKNCREQLERNQKGAVLEQLSDQIRGWLHEYRTHTGKIPEYTGSDRGVSRMMASRQGTDSDISKSTQSSSKESKSKKSKSPKSRESKSMEEDEDVVSSRAIVSSFLPELTIRKEEYDDLWKYKDESSNPRQHGYFDIIENEQMTTMENELRKIVDEMMRSELQLLQEAYDKDRGYKGKRQKKAKTKRGSKKGKKKKEKDLTPDRTIESLFEELVANGIIKRTPEVYLSDFIGDRSYHHPVPHNKDEDLPIFLGDVRQVITDNCIIPLLSPNLHQTTPHLKSILISGFKESGKSMLVHAICTEAGALFFDLTPSNIVGKYPGKSGLTMLIHLVLKVARLLQPAVIYMNNAERPFVKKIPKTDATDPKRLKKDLAKIVKNFGPEDRVILIGVSSCPWESDQKLLQQVYQKFLILPKPEYSSRYSVWQNLLRQYSAIGWQFDLSAMSKISDGYTIGSIVSSVQEVMTVKRVLQLRVHSLSPLELVNALCKRIPIYKEEEEALYLWWSRTPLCKRKSVAIEALEEEQAEMQAKQANAKRNM